MRSANHHHILERNNSERQMVSDKFAKAAGTPAGQQGEVYIENTRVSSTRKEHENTSESWRDDTHAELDKLLMQMQEKRSLTNDHGTDTADGQTAGHQAAEMANESEWDDVRWRKSMLLYVAQACFRKANAVRRG